MFKTADEFQTFANSVGSGYLKPWKAYSMWATFLDSPHIIADETRLNAYVKNCLLMEGFTMKGCDLVSESVMVRFT